MNTFTEKSFEYFKHITRDILIYALSGAVVIINLIFLCEINKLITFEDIKKWNFLITLIVAYVLGHIIKRIADLFDEDSFKKLQKDEIEVFCESEKLYVYFIERWNQLYYMRKNLAWAFLVSGGVSFGLMFLHTILLLNKLKNFDPITIFHYLISIIINLIVFGILYSSYKETKDKFKKTIENCKINLKNCESSNSNTKQKEDNE